MIAAGVGGVLVWTMAAHDPYWRLFETPSLPAPGYETPAEIEAALASAAVPGATMLAGIPDSVAVRPEAAGTGGTEPRGAAGGVPMALAPRPAEPLIAVHAALDPGPEGDLAPATAGDPAVAGLAPAMFDPTAEDSGGAGPTVALGPPSPFQPGLGPFAGAVIADASALAPVHAAGAPAPLWVPADEASEQVLALTRSQRADVQRRLALAGFDPRGFDGVFGSRTRQAIADFQAAWGFPSTGYLDSSVHADLRARTEEAYAALASRAAREPRAAPKLAPVAREREFAAVETDGCARDENGRIVERQSFGCDLQGLAEKVVSLGRNKLAHEEAGAEAGAAPAAVTAAGGGGPVFAAGAER